MKHLLTIPSAVVSDPAVGPHALRLLLILSSYANSDGWSWPKLSTLGKTMGVSKSGVAYHMDHLTKLRYVQKRKMMLPVGVEVTAYRLLYDRPIRRSIPLNTSSVSSDGTVQPDCTMESLTTESRLAPPETEEQLLARKAAIEAILGPKPRP